MVDSRDKRKSIADEEAKKRPRCADGDPLAEKNIANLLASRAHRPENTDVAGLVGDRHGKNHKNVEPGDEGNQTDENGRDQLFQTQRPE